MTASIPRVLTLNAGSSSIRFALYELAEPLERRLTGKLERIGSVGTSLLVKDEEGQLVFSSAAPSGSPQEAALFLLNWLSTQPEFDSIVGIGHRIVHGMRHVAPEWVTQELLNDLHAIIPYDPEHLPAEIELMELFQRRHPHLRQLACFDTAFHQNMPRVARLLSIPRRYESQGLQRYGFHGLSYAYLLEELGRLGDPAATKGRVVMAHLGNGASMTAVRDGRGIDTSMGFTPTAGLPMSTRSGDLDPGLITYLLTQEKLTPTQLHHLVNHESGLIGISETSSDMRDLLAKESVDVRAAEAVSYFCYQTKKWIGSYAAALGGVDTLVFAGGIGENAPIVRARICAGLSFMGIELDEARNQNAEPVISTPTSRVTVRVIRTNEELMIAHSLRRMLGFTPPVPQ